MIPIFLFHSFSAAEPVTGPLAASTITLQFNESTFVSLIALPNAAGIKKSYVKTALSDVEFKVSSCNKRTIRISSIGDNS